MVPRMLHEPARDHILKLSGARLGPMGGAMDVDHLTFTFKCLDCGGTVLELPDDATDDSIAVCKACRRSHGRYGDIKAKALDLAGHTIGARRSLQWTRTAIAQSWLWLAETVRSKLKSWLSACGLEGEANRKIGG